MSKVERYAVFFMQYFLEFEITKRLSENFLSLSASWRQLMKHLTFMSNLATRDIVHLPVFIYFTKAVGQFTVTNMATMRISLVYPTPLTWADTESVLSNR
jgi:hypothetical protein